MINKNILKKFNHTNLKECVKSIYGEAKHIF